MVFAIGSDKLRCITSPWDEDIRPDMTMAMLITNSAFSVLDM
jgi:hypothetical protein